MPSRLGPDELRTLYERYAPSIHRLARRLLGREQEAWDAVHDVFCILLERGAHFRNEAKPMTYVYRVTTNVALGALRARVLREPKGTERAADVVTPERAEARELLVALTRVLDERALRIAALHFMEGLTQEEIGEVVGLSRKTVGKELETVRRTAEGLAGGPK